MNEDGTNFTVAKYLSSLSSTVPSYRMLWRSDDDHPSHLQEVLVSNLWLGLSSQLLIFTI